MDTPTPQTSTQAPASGETPEQVIRCCSCGKLSRNALGEYVRRDGSSGYINSRGSHDGPDICSDCIDGAATVIAGLRAQLTRLTQTIDQDRQTIAALREEIRALKNEKNLGS